MEGTHSPRPAESISLSEEGAAALDAAINDALAGRPVDRDLLLVRHPDLAGAVAGLDQLLNAQPTRVGADPPCAPPAAVPAQIGPYRVERELGVGGFGVVYLAFDPDVRRRVALKVLHVGRLEQPEVLLRFQREACVTARLRHPGIVRLFDYSRQGPPYYLVTEYVEGVEPRLWCRQHGLGPAGVAALVARIAEVVEHAHGEKVWHRDLKPGNILIDAAGDPHVLDFGLARDLERAAESQAPTSDGRVLGSLPYMAPEQASGRSHSADARSDVYSLGVILYELLTGRLPFQGAGPALLYQIVEETPPPPRRFNGAVPPGLEQVCLKALAKRPEDRYASAAALAGDLRRFLEGEATEAARTSWSGRVRRALDRRHRDTTQGAWTPLLLLVGVTILVGCALANYWELTLPPTRRWLPMLLTKVAQVAVMLFLAVRLRPVKAEGMTAAERQIWTLVPAYYGAYLALLVVNHFTTVPLAPVLAILSGMGFATLGASIWGWFYVWSLGFFGLAVLIALGAPQYGLTLLGLGWFVCLAIGGVHLRYSR